MDPRRVELQKLVDNGSYVVVSRRDDVRRELRKLKDVISEDVETGASTSGGNDGADPLRNRLLCVGVSDGKHTVVIWPWRKTHAPLLNALHRRVRTISMHNGYNFDQIVLARNGVPFEDIEEKLEDTLIGHHTFASHMPQRLSHVSSVFIDASPWKITFKQGTGGASEKGSRPRSSAAKTSASTTPPTRAFKRKTGSQCRPISQTSSMSMQSTKRTRACAEA